ncbi:uncharacterized protein LOC117111924 isoform X1 [Anneissia japonica]|uniref:uncharacterized protein LOC117111924 isoform X1 n=1 Tax=Anneissia japonica TaxID=1529436 RepID=UPI00142597E7|nr:uncharacterized protein LOC117111924 isoform X1 [Anneissia japonica]
MTEEGTTIVIYDDSFPAIRNETVETTVATAILQGFGDSAKAIQLDGNIETVQEDDEEQKKEKKRIKFKQKCLFFEDCSKSFEQQADVVDHLIAEHGVERDHLLLEEFNSIEDFKTWKDHLELDNYVYYTRRNKQDKRFVYYCCRDGQPNPEVKKDGEISVDQETKTTLRKTKLTKKYGLTCPSKMIARMLDTGKVELFFYKIHSHPVAMEDTRNHPVPQLLRQELYAQFALDATVDEVYEMLHGKETTVYPVFKAVIRDLNKRRLRKIAKDFHADCNINKHSGMWNAIKHSAQMGRMEGPVAAEENKKSKLVSVQHKLEQLYHLLDEPVTQSLLLDYLDSTLSKLLKECSAAFAVSDFKFPLEDEYLRKYDKQKQGDIDKHWEEALESMDTFEGSEHDGNSGSLDDRSREFVAQEENLMNQGVKRDITESDMKQQIKRTCRNDRENNQPRIDPNTGKPVIKVKQNRKKLFNVPQRPRFPGLPMRTLDVIRRNPEAILSLNTDASDCSVNKDANATLPPGNDNGEDSSSHVPSDNKKKVSEASTGVKEVSDDGKKIESLPECHAAEDAQQNTIGREGMSGSVTATEVLEQLQSDANQVQEVIQMEIENSDEASVHSQLLEIVNLAKAMVEGDCASDQVIIVNENSDILSDVIEVSEEKDVTEKQ